MKIGVHNYNNSIDNDTQCTCKNESYHHLLNYLIKVYHTVVIFG